MKGSQQSLKCSAEKSLPPRRWKMPGRWLGINPQLPKGGFVSLASNFFIQMKSAIILLLIIGFMFFGYFLNSWLQKIIKPKQSLGRLLFYFLSVLIAVFVLSFFMVFVIGKL